MCGAYVVTLVNWTLIFGHPKYTYYNEIGLCAQIMNSILCSIIQIVGRAHLINYIEKNIFILDS